MKIELSLYLCYRAFNNQTDMLPQNVLQPARLPNLTWPSILGHHKPNVSICFNKATLKKKQLMGRNNDCIIVY